MLLNRPFTGILYLRMATIQVTETIDKLSRFLKQHTNLQPPFIIVIQDNKVRIRQL